MLGATVGPNLAQELARDPLPVMSQPTLWGHASPVPGRGWRGAVPPLTPRRPSPARRVVARTRMWAAPLATGLRARAWPCPRARRAAYLALLGGMVLDRDPRPVIDCIAKAGVGGHAAHHELELAGPLRDRRDAREAFGRRYGCGRPQPGWFRVQLQRPGRGGFQGAGRPPDPVASTVPSRLSSSHYPDDRHHFDPAPVDPARAAETVDAGRTLFDSHVPVRRTRGRRGAPYRGGNPDSSSSARG